jgi:hypothetical protein
VNRLKTFVAAALAMTLVAACQGNNDHTAASADTSWHLDTAARETVSR